MLIVTPCLYKFYLFLLLLRYKLAFISNSSIWSLVDKVKRLLCDEILILQFGRKKSVIPANKSKWSYIVDISSYKRWLIFHTKPYELSQKYSTNYFGWVLNLVKNQRYIYCETKIPTSVRWFEQFKEPLEHALHCTALH